MEHVTTALDRPCAEIAGGHGRRLRLASQRVRSTMKTAVVRVPADDLLREAPVMVTELDPRQGAEKGLKPYRLTVEQFEKMIDAGVFPDRPRVELLGGVLFRKMTKNDPHDFAVDFLGSVLNRLLEPAWLAREEKSVVLGKFWRPEPDIAVVRGPRERYRKRATARRGPGPLDRSLRRDIFQRPRRQVARVCVGRSGNVLDRQPASRVHRGLHPPIGAGKDRGFSGRRVPRDRRRSSLDS